MKKILLIVLVISIFAGGVFLGTHLPKDISFGRVKDYLYRNIMRHVSSNFQEKADYGKANMDSAKAKVTVTVYPDQEKGTISPLIYGSNLSPKMESTPPVLNFIKEIGITCFRYPGGSSPGWHWKLGYADFNSKVINMPLGSVKVLSGVAERTNTEIIMQVNLESGTPQEAAGLVKFMNQESGTPVRYWVLGNEVFGSWDKAHTTPEKYAQIIKDYAKAMKAVDPAIKIGANWGGAYYDKNKWDETVLKLAGNEIDFVDYHWYPSHVSNRHPYQGRAHPKPENVMANALAIPEMLDRFHSLVEQNAPQREGKIEFTILEWDGAWDAPTSDPKPPYAQGIVQWSLANAIFYADAFGQFAENGVSVATLFTFQECPFGLIRGWNRGEGYGGRIWDEKTIRPKAFALQLFSKYFGDTLIAKKVEGGLTYTKQEDWWPSSYTGQVPYLTAYAAKQSDNGFVTIALINKHADSEIDVNIVLESEAKKYDQCQARILTGPDLMAQNDGSPGKVYIEKSDPFLVGKNFTFPVPAHSVVMLELKNKE